MSGPERVTLAMTGASGAPYGLRLLDCLVREDREVHFLISKAAQLVMATETDVALPPKVQGMEAFRTEGTGGGAGERKVGGGGGFRGCRGRGGRGAWEGWTGRLHGVRQLLKHSCRL